MDWYPTPEEVIEAYEATGLVPAPGSILYSQSSGCALGAIAMQHLALTDRHLYSIDGLAAMAAKVLKETWGAQNDEVIFGLGFDDGFSYNSNNIYRRVSSAHPAYIAGHAAGVSVKEWWDTKEVVPSEATHLQAALV